jgi:hypothetical protein
MMAVQPQSIVQLLRPAIARGLFQAVLFGIPIYQFQVKPVSWGLVIVGGVGLFFAELGSLFAKDYYVFRRNRENDVGRCTIAGQMDPPLLVLKAIGAAYLTSFLFVLILALSMGGHGWPILVIATIGFFPSYFRGAPKYYLDETKFGRMWVWTFVVLTPLSASLYCMYAWNV